jgi:PKD repeat protein
MHIDRFLTKLILLPLLLLPQLLASQYVFERAFLHTVGELVLDIEPSADGGMYMVFQQNSNVLALCKTDSIGKMLWSKTIGPGVNDGHIEIGSDTSIYITATTSLYKLDANGNTLWRKTMPLSIRDFDIAADQEIYVTGGYQISQTWQTVVAKLDTSGNAVWAMRYAGFEPSGVAAKKAGGCYVVCNAGGSGNLIRMGDLGNHLWIRAYNVTNIKFAKVVETLAEEAFVMGSRVDFYTSTCVMRTDSAGNKLWSYEFGPIHSRFDYPLALTATVDSGAAMIGVSSNGPFYFEKDHYAAWFPKTGQSSFWINMDYGTQGAQVLMNLAGITTLRDGSVAYVYDEGGLSGLFQDIKSRYGNLKRTGPTCKARTNGTAPTNNAVLVTTSISPPVAYTFTTPAAAFANTVNNQGDTLLCLICNQPAVAGFGSTTTGYSASFTNTSTQATTYHWDFGDGSTSTQANPVHAYGTGGTYNVCLTAYGPCGSNTVCHLVPVCDFAAMQGVPVICQGQSFSFSSTSVGEISRQWLLDAAFLTNSGTASATLGTVGNHLLTLISYNGQCYDTLTTTVVVTNSPPALAFSSSAVNRTHSFANNSVNGTSWYWTFGDGGTSTLQNPVHTYAANGTYTVCLIGTNGCGADTLCQQVTVTCPLANINFSYSVSNRTVTVTNLSSNATSYEWLWGDGGSTILANPLPHTYATYGTYNLCLIAVNSCGSDTFCQTVNVVCQLPVPAFTNSNSGPTFTFSNASTGATTYFWTFGDGTNSTAANPVHTYSVTGSYTVCLTATNTCGNTTICDTVSAICPPILAGFSASGVGTTKYFQDQSTSGATSWYWTFGDGGTSTLQNPSHTYAFLGNYNVCLTVTNICTTNTHCQTVYLCNSPIASFSTTVNGYTANFNNTSSGYSNLLWDFGDGSTSILTTPSHTYAANGTYNVCLTISNPCDTTIICHAVTICPSPTAAFTRVANGLNVQFTSTSTGAPSSYAWTFGDGGTSTLQNPGHIYLASGTYNVCLTVTNTCGSHTTCQTLTICNSVNAAFSSTTNNLNATFSNSTTGATTYAWTFGDGGTSNQQNPSHVYIAPGNYNVCLTASNACYTSTVCHVVTVCNGPTSMFTSVTNALNCQFADASSGAPTAWFWDFGDGGTSTVQNPNHVFAMPGTYNVCLTVSNNCSTGTYCDTVTICQFPSAIFTFTNANLTYLFDGSGSTGAMSWNWDFGDGGTSPVANPSHTYANTGTYIVCLIVQNTCGGDTACQTLNPVAIHPQLSGFRMEVSPNPAEEWMVLHLFLPTVTDLQLRITDLQGRILQHQLLPQVDGELRYLLDVSKLSSGMYLIEVLGEGLYAMRKVVVE